MMSEKFTADQCNQHWRRVLDPSIKKGKWTEEEDQALLKAVSECGDKLHWGLVAQKIPGRTDSQVRYRYKYLLSNLEKRKRKAI